MNSTKGDTLFGRFPWLAFVRPVMDSIADTLMEKEDHYAGSWKKRGGTGAFMVMARKWDRIENICERLHKYDIIDAVVSDTGGIGDDIDDLIGYLALIRAEGDRLKGVKAPITAREDGKVS